MAGDEAKAHALNTSDDFYALLNVAEGAGESEIRRAYRKTALLYHPDKVGADAQALEKFHLLQIAYDVLSDPTVKELYDNARRARQQKAERDRAYEGRRKWMKEDLERRESGAFKRKREDDEEKFEQELRRLAEDGKRRRKEREEQLRQDARDLEREEAQNESRPATPSESTHRGTVAELDRSISLRFPQNEQTRGITDAALRSRFDRFGKIEDAVLREKKFKVEGEKHRRPYLVAVLVFESIVGAHAAVSDFDKVARLEPEDYGIFEAVGWAAGKEPDCIPKAAGPQTPASKSRPAFNEPKVADSMPTTPTNGQGAGLRKAPSFGSFKGTPRPATAGVNSPSLDEITMIRLKNAERRRLEEKIRRDEAAATAQETSSPP